MTKYCLTDSLIGKYYPFFLNNFDFHEYYLYQLYSPGLSENYIPLISLDMISVKTWKKNDAGILNYLSTDPLEKMKEILRWHKESEVTKGNGAFPCAEMKDTNVVQRDLILGLRDALRWKTYKFYIGSKVDVLWTEDEFVVFKICSDKTHIWLEAEGMYKNSDVTLSNPLPVDLGKINNEVKKEKWEKNGKASELNRYIKKLESYSFDRNKNS